MASTARVDFTKGAAERIARVVVQVENGGRDGTPLTFGRALDGAAVAKVFPHGSVYVFVGYRHHEGYHVLELDGDGFSAQPIRGGHNGNGVHRYGVVRRRS